jgi:hypothetical protein
MAFALAVTASIAMSTFASSQMGSPSLDGGVLCGAHDHGARVGRIGRGLLHGRCA